MRNPAKWIPLSYTHKMAPLSLAAKMAPLPPETVKATPISINNENAQYLLSEACDNLQPQQNLHDCEQLNNLPQTALNVMRNDKIEYAKYLLNGGDKSEPQ